MVGVLANIATILANANVSIFSISTFNTDYILVKADALSLTIEILEAKGYDLK